jgi:integrator complex subunit 5
VCCCRSCFPEVIISRVMMCGLSDFSIHCDSDSEVSNVPKIPSVAGILTHLAVQHGGIVRLAISTLIQVRYFIFR